MESVGCGAFSSHGGRTLSYAKIGIILQKGKLRQIKLTYFFIIVLFSGNTR